MGRPSSFKPEYVEQVYRLSLLGLTDKEMAVFFGVSDTCFDNWKLKYPEFMGSIKNGKENADGKVTESLYKRALGYSHPEDKVFNNNGEALIVPTIKHYPPDTGAIIFWLCNRTHGKWKNQKYDNGNGDADTNGTMQELLNKLSESRGK